MQKENFTIAIPDDTLGDLHDRLARTRFAPEFANSQWDYGTNGAYLKELIEYWRDTYDWRKVEREINSFSITRPPSTASPSISSTSPARDPSRFPSS